MKNSSVIFQHLIQTALDRGAHRAGVVDVAAIELDAIYRDMCAANTCGKYGTCWMCPPDVGDIHTLMADLRTYDHALVYQTVGQLEDSFDIEGMAAAAQTHNRLTAALMQAYEPEAFLRHLHLGAGGCHVCAVCAKQEQKPCRFPDRAISSLEAYGIQVSQLAELAGMPYINGQNTVTYFGALFFTL